MIENDGMPVCEDCINYNDKHCDFNDSLVFEDDDPKDKCNYKGFKRIERKYGKRT